MQAETREEKLLTAISNGEKSGIVPYTRQEKFLSYIAGETDEKPTPITRIEMFLDKIERGGGGGDGTAVIRPLTVTENGTYIPPAGTDGYAPINVNIPEKTPILEQKHIIKNGFHAPSEGYDGIGIAWVEVEPITESIAVTENGTYIPAEGVDGFSEVKVEVQASGGGSDKLAQMVDGTITEVTAADLGEITTIRDYVFYKNSALVSVEIPKTVTSIGNSAFSYCGVKNIVIPKNVSTFGSYCFNESSLESITFENASKISFPDGSFKNCKKLSSVYIDDLWGWCGIVFSTSEGSNPMSYGANLYVNNNLVTNFIVPDEVTSIKQGNFFGCKSLQGVTLNDNMTSIGTSTFRNCSNLSNIYLGKSLTTVGAYTFYSCSALTSIDIPDGVTRIGVSFCQNCKNITNVTIGSGIKEIMSNAFNACSGLISLTVKATTPPTLASNSLTSVPADCAIYVPAESVDAYKAATNWSARADYIFAIEEGA